MQNMTSGLSATGHMWTAHRLRIVRSLRRLFGQHCQRASIMAIAEQMSDASLQEWLESELQFRNGRE